MTSFHVICGLGLPQSKILGTPINWRSPEKIFEDLFFSENACACVLGPWPWPRAFLSLASRGSVLRKAVLGLGLFLCPWPWPRALCPRLHLCCLIIPPKKTLSIPNSSIYFSDSAIKINDAVKYLGITINNRLNFEEHINALATKISRSIGILRKILRILPVSALRHLYYSMIHPHLVYGITVWGNAFDKHLIRLATTQNKAVKLISEAQWRDHVTPSYLKLQVKYYP